MVVRDRRRPTSRRAARSSGAGRRSTLKPCPAGGDRLHRRSTSPQRPRAGRGLLKLVAVQPVAHQPITLPLAQQALADHLHRTQRVLGTVSDIDQTVADLLRPHPGRPAHLAQDPDVALARSIAMYLARKHTDMSFPEIGRFMGNKNHSTVILASRRIDKIIAEDEVVRWPTPTCRKSMKLNEVLQQSRGPVPGLIDTKVPRARMPARPSPLLLPGSPLRYARSLLSLASHLATGVGVRPPIIRGLERFPLFCAIRLLLASGGHGPALLQDHDGSRYKSTGSPSSVTYGGIMIKNVSSSARTAATFLASPANCRPTARAFSATF